MLPRRRAAPLRLERVQRRALPVGAAPARRAPLPGRARACARRASTSSTPSPIRARPRSSSTIEPEELDPQHRLLAPAHDALRPRRDLHVARSAAPNGADEGGGIFLLDCETFDPLGRVGGGSRAAAVRLRFLVAPRPRHADHQRVGHADDVRERASCPRSCSAASTATRMHVWDLRKRRHMQALDLGDEHQMVLELRPAHDPRKAYGFVGVVVSVEDLSASVWLWHRDGGEWKIQKVITIPAEPADADSCRRCSRASAPCRRWSPTSTCRSTTASSTSPAGAPAIPPVRRQRPVQPEADRHGAAGRHRLAAGAHPARRRRSTAGRRWSR